MTLDNHDPDAVASSLAAKGTTVFFPNDDTCPNGDPEECICDEEEDDGSINV
jgi:hypothetical protein